ncbi:Aste57867_12639 [Aphanomyces stellatus]|uniref:Aste57867_12639 protein n=1 Tax=Aphanomyces stellatus TaxID=120398 RepID=A0A485KW46_9STRA|nr:hypothetical protein As57867_012593 [Aphanomyces stellatus]VFT89489.1 Aste57867_12639 [Aphanomyces stellatus]
MILRALSPTAIESRVENDTDMTDAEYATYLSQKKFFNDPANRHMLADDKGTSVKDERRCDFEIIDVPLRRKKEEPAPIVEEEEPETDELSVHLAGWEQQWRGELKTHEKRIMHEIMLDPRDPGMARMLFDQKITQVHGHKLSEHVLAAMHSMGENLFATMKANFSKAHQNGMFTTDQTVTRLLSAFKVELRTIMTVDAVKQKVLLACMEEVYGSREAGYGLGMNLHRFKLEALERLFDARDEPRHHGSRASRERKFQLLRDQIEDYEWTTQSHLLSYHGKNTEESRALLRKILVLICRIPYLDIVPLPFKVCLIHVVQDGIHTHPQAEMAKATTFHKQSATGHVFLQHDVVAREVYLLLDGRVECRSASSGAVTTKADHDLFICGEVDVLTSRASGEDVRALTPVTYAVLSKRDMEAILKFSFNPAALLDKHLTNGMHLAVRPHKQQHAHAHGHTRPHNAIAQVVNVAKALAHNPHIHRDHVKRSRCAESKHFSEVYIRTKRHVAPPPTTTKEETTNSEASSPDIDVMSDSSRRGSDVESSTGGATKTIAHVQLLTRMRTADATAPPNVRSRGRGQAPASSFEFFPTFVDRFDTQQLDILFLMSKPFPMDEMRLDGIGPPCPEAPSFIMPPRVEIDTAVLLLDQLLLLCKTSGNDIRRQSVDPTLNHAMVFHTHHGYDDDFLDALAPLTLSVFVDGRKKLTSAAVKGQKTPFASVSLYCSDWTQPMTDSPTEAKDNDDENSFLHDEQWLAAAAQAMGSETLPVAQLSGDTNSTANVGSRRGSVNYRERSALQTRKDNNKDEGAVETDPNQPAAKPKKHHEDGAPGGSPDSENDPDFVGDLVTRSPRRPQSVLSGAASPRSFLTDDPAGPDNQGDDDGASSHMDGSGDDDDADKHLFRVQSKASHRLSSPRQSGRRLMSGTPIQAQSRRDVFHKVVKQLSRAVVEEKDPTMHMKQLEIEQKLEEELGKAMLEDGKPCPWRIKLQKRMEHVLTALELSARRKLQVVMKYTNVKHSPKLEGALELWEKAVNCIMDREATLKRVYEFELVASDPRRLFQTISTHRLKEQRQRDRLFLLLDNHTKFCQRVLAQLAKEYNDIVFYRDRSYAEKMQHDYTEMLYDLEQVRLRVYFGGVMPDVPTTVLPPSAEDADPALSMVEGNHEQVGSPEHISGDLAHPPVGIAVAIKRQEEKGETIVVVDELGYHGRLRGIVKEIGDANLTALKEELHRQRMEERAAAAAAHLEEVQEKINRRRLPTRPPAPKPKEKSMQESLHEMLDKLRPKKTTPVLPT